MEKGNDITTISLNPLLGFITNRKLSWLRHTLFILAGLILAFKGDKEMLDRLHASVDARRSILLMDFLMFASSYLALYMLILVFIPKLLFRSRIFLFFLSYVVIILFIYIVSYLLEFYFLKPHLPYDPSYQYNTFSITDIIQKGLVICVLLGCVTGLVVFKKWASDVHRINELQQAHLKSELEQLKSQVNPHFLFNTLNNLQVLTKTDPEKASQVLFGLSDLLRYQLYDSAKEKIYLAKDIAFIYNLLSLEKIRKDDFDFTIKTEGNLEAVTLPAFLFIPFVENAIKHGASTAGHSYLKLRFVLTDEHLYFNAENSKPTSKNNLPGGIGLKNIRRRLELLYPGKHSLEIRDEKNKYTVNLILSL